MSNFLPKLFEDLMEIEPIEANVDHRPNIPTDTMCKQGENIFEEFLKVKRRKERKRMLLYMYYLGELLESNEVSKRHLKQHPYLT